MISKTPPRRQHAARWIVGIVAAAVLLSVGAAYAVISTEPMTNQQLVINVNSLCTAAKDAPNAAYVVDECGPITTDDVTLFLHVWCTANPAVTSEITPDHAAKLSSLLGRSRRC